MADARTCSVDRLKRCYDVIVVGAGISGLTAAFEVLKKIPNAELLVLEAKDRVGGRLLGTRLKAANGHDTWDLGGQWVSRNQTAIIELMEELGVQTYEQWYSGGKIIQLSDGTVRKYSYSLPTMSYFSLIDIYWINSKIEALCQEVPLDDPRNCPNAELWDSMTIETWINQVAWTLAAKELFHIATAIVFGMTPSQMSLLFFLHYIHSAGGWATLVESGLKGSAQEWKIKGGAYQLTTMLAEKIGWKNIHLGKPVTAINQECENVVITTLQGETFSAKYVILTIPPPFIGKIRFAPVLPYSKRKLIENMPVGHLIKFIATYKRAFWRKAGMSGEAVHTTMAGSCEVDPVSFTIDGTTSEGNPALVGFIGSYAAAEWSTVCDEEKKRTILKSLTKYFGPDAAEPLDFALKDWANEEWNGGCPVSVMVPGAISNYGDCLREPFLRVHWAGTDISCRWRGYISGAVDSGRIAAHEVIDRLKDNNNAGSTSQN